MARHITFEQFCIDQGRSIAPGSDEAARAEGERRKLIELWDAQVQSGWIIPTRLTEEEGEAMIKAREAREA